MRATLLLSAGLVFGFVARAEGPYYTAASIVNAADNRSGWLAPNTIATMYGTGLAYDTKALTAADIHDGILPTALPGTGVRILVGSLPAVIYFVSPTQINFLTPSYLLPGPATVQVVLDGLAGPVVHMKLAVAAPALFETHEQNAVATRPNGSLVTQHSPAKPGGWVILYATGLGQTIPPVIYGEVPTAAAPLEQMNELKVTLDGVPVDRYDIYYAGLAPYFAGLYQINLKLPDSTGTNPEIRVALGAQISRPGLKIPVQP